LGLTGVGPEQKRTRCMFDININPEWFLLALAPVFVAAIGLEFLYWQRRGVAKYSWIDSVSNVSLSLLHQASDFLFSLLFVKTVYTFVYETGLKAVPPALWSFLALFVLQDFLYYFFHRAHHRIRWMWCSHVVHHSSERLNLSTALRQSLTYPLSGMWAFWLPLTWLGFEPDHVVLMVGLSLAYQFFVHTEAVGKLGALEWVFNTPSHHRVHHGKNAQYIDRNYGGILIIWDRLFGTFAEEQEKPEYGIVRQVHSHNPLFLTFHEWMEMGRDVWTTRDLRFLWKPPEWRGRYGELEVPGRGRDEA
jgi:sterol desaturase/sphingolipid hydroxylase (fatty acid hydroxylase superfamily)